MTTNFMLFWNSLVLVANVMENRPYIWYAFKKWTDNIRKFKWNSYNLMINWIVPLNPRHYFLIFGLSIESRIFGWFFFPENFSWTTNSNLNVTKYPIYTKFIDCTVHTAKFTRKYMVYPHEYHARTTMSWL